MRSVKATCNTGLITWVCTAACGCYPLFPRTPIYDDVADADGSSITADAVASEIGVDDGFTVQVFNDCTLASFLDRSAAGLERIVYFGGTGASAHNTYTPACMIVAPGQSVRFQGNFLEHPLRPGTNPTELTAGSPNNPIQPTLAGQDVTVTFANSGVYPYFCETHILDGMAGVVWVR